MKRVVACLALVIAGCASPRVPEYQHDLVVYGATASGVTAAVRGAMSGLDVVLVAPTQHLGGLTSSGLGATDIGNKQAVGGIARGFYQRIRGIYKNPARWTRENREAFRGWRDDEDALWYFEPHVAEEVFESLVADAGVSVIRGERLDLDGGVALSEMRIDSIRTESGRTFRGSMFIDATYEGDLMALAGVPYTVGREGNTSQAETLNGVQTRNAKSHQFVAGVDPYRIPGDPLSGLLPGVQYGPPGPEGSGDHRVQAYCFRLCLTDDPSNRIPFSKPIDYDVTRYELLLRHFEAGATHIPWNPIAMPNRKTDTNNNRAVSTDHIGANYDYPDGDYSVRAAIIDDHESYQRGLLWTLANHPRIPPATRDVVSKWGLAADEFTDNDNWPRMLYIREARRMVSDYVMAESNCVGHREAPDSIGLAAYNMDSHNVQRYVDRHGFSRNEGDIQVAPSAPYPISYRSIIPPRGSIENLLVPVCVSATHIAFGSIRMEPVFMVLGHSAATAAVLAIEHGTSVQDVLYPKLAARLQAERQVLRRPPISDPVSRH